MPGSEAREAPPAEPPPRRIAADLGEAIWSVLTTAAGAAIGVGLVGPVSAQQPLALLLVACVIVFVGDLAAGPVLRRLAAIGNVPLALLLGLAGQVAVLAAALHFTPGLRTSGFWSIVNVLLISALVMALGRWLMGAADSSYVVGSAIRRGRSQTRRAFRAASAAEPHQAPSGLLIVQLDGVSPEVLRRAIRAGQVPTLATWLTERSHVLEQWWVPVPCTTPASMAGFLHGDDETVVAFRWWDRNLGRLVVTNRPSDAELVEQQLRAGDGLLRDGGVAVSTMFSGEAETSLLVMSRVLRDRRGLGPASSYAPFFTQAFLLPRALVLTVGEVVKELFQGRRQRLRGVQPRVHRLGAYVLLRGVTNVLLRDLNLSLVAEHMTKGAPAIFVDLVDYDEIAHHAGPERPEAMRALEGLDAVLHQLTLVADAVPTDYRIVVVSDHGQSLGSTFKQLTGQTLTGRAADLMAAPGGQPGGSKIDHITADAGEEFGPLNALIGSVIRSRKGSPDRVLVGPDRPAPTPGTTDTAELPELAAIASGNLGMLWFPHLPQRPGLAEITRHWPRLLPGLSMTPGVGLVMVRGDDGGIVVLGPDGLRTGDGPGGMVDTVHGDDPLAPYPVRAFADLLRLDSLQHCGDVVIVSTVDALGMVHAFEELVGSHGGLGGDQNSGLLIHPADWRVDPRLRTPLGAEGQRRLVGSVAIHDQLLQWRHAHGAGPKSLATAPYSATTPGDD